MLGPPPQPRACPGHPRLGVALKCTCARHGGVRYLFHPRPRESRQAESVSELLPRAPAPVHNSSTMSVAALFALAKSGPSGEGSVEALLRTAKAARTTESSTDSNSATAAPSSISSGDAEAALLKAARSGDDTAVKQILFDHPHININARGAWDGMTALHWAADKGHIDIVRTIIKAGSEVDSRDSNKWTPLMVAVQKNQLEVAQLLMSLGACTAIKVGGRPVDWHAQAIDDAMLEILKVAPTTSAPAIIASTASTTPTGKRPHPNDTMADKDGPPSSRTRIRVRGPTGVWDV